MNKFRLLDLFCGAGGASMGYYRAGFEVVGVDYKSQKNYPFEFHKTDAMSFPLGGFDVIHASPPCQRYSKCTPIEYRRKHPDLISDIRKRMIKSGSMFVIENVEGAKRLLKQPIMLCGSFFNLPIRRHRFFEVNPMIIILTPSCSHIDDIVYITGTPRPKNSSRKDPSADIKREAMNTPWMTIKEMDEAIPPAYTEFIGKHLIKRLKDLSM